MNELRYKISNGTLTAEISAFGAQLRSLKDKNGKEYMWEANPDIWPKSAPIMFPICGGLKEDAFYHNGKRYDLPKHGFGCSYDYILVSHTDTAVSLKIVSTDETRAMYPFEFEFIVTFELIGESLKVTYTTVNTGTEALYHAPGGHEGYALPEGIEEYDVVFDEYENLMRSVIDGNLIEHKNEYVETDGKKLHMKYSHMDNDCLAFDHVNSNGVNLVHRVTGKGVRVEFADFAHLTIWTKKGAPYLCIEPWQGIADFVDATMVLAEKYSMCKLEPGCKQSFVHTITPIV